MTAKIGSLFSGYGGLDLAVSAVTGAEVVWHCEWDDAPSKILERNFPGVPNYRDVSKVDWSSVEPVDILTGGFPCQDLSLAGKRAGLRDGTRSGLWSEFALAIETIRPSLVVIENVRGLLSATAHSDVEPCPWCVGDSGDGEPVLRALGAVLGDLADLGYDAEWTGVRASDAGAPHARFRVFIVAQPGGVELLRTPSAIEGEGGAISEDEARAKGRMLQVRDQMAQLAAENGLKVAPGIANAMLPTPSAAKEPGFTISPVDKNGNPTSNPNERWYHPETGQLLQKGLIHAIQSSWGKFAPAIERWEKVLGRPAPAPTKPDGKDGAHRLSSAFTEWMMGLPEGWITDVGLTRNEELKACGNGVVPQQAELALRHLLDGMPLTTGGGASELTNTNGF